MKCLVFWLDAHNVPCIIITPAAAVFLFYFFMEIFQGIHEFFIKTMHKLHLQSVREWKGCSQWKKRGIIYSMNDRERCNIKY